MCESRVNEMPYIGRSAGFDSELHRPEFYSWFHEEDAYFLP